MTHQLIRSFSDEFGQTCPGDILGRGLSTAVAIERQRERDSTALKGQWNALLNEGRQLAVDLIPDEESVLLSQSRQLYKAWTKFCNSLPQGQQLETLQDVPSLKLLYQHVDRASSTWKEQRDGTKSGRLKTVFTKLCDTVHSHSKLVSMIPTNDKYVTLLTGSLSAIASACTNHEKLATGVSESLEELSQDMAYWNGMISLFPEQEMMQRYIMELYTVVFEFLTEIFTQWSRSPWKRFIKSFDEQAFHELFVEKRKRIKAIENRMQRHASGFHMRSDATFQTETRRWQSGVERTLTQIMHKLGIDVQSVLESKVTLPPPSQKSIEPLPTPGEIFLDPVPNMSLPGETPRARDTACNATSDTSSLPSVRDVLKLLEPIAIQHNNKIQELVSLTSAALKTTVDIQIKRRLEAWTSGLASNRIWIQGPHNVSHPSQNTLTAACLVGLANNAKVPCISYFASLQSRDPRGAYPSTPEILLDMVKSLIIQLLLLQQPNMTLGTQLMVFEKLLVRVDLDNLRKVLREIINLGEAQLPRPHLGEGSGAGADIEGGPEKSVKVCFTSDGHADVLAVAAQGGFMDKIAWDADDEAGEGEQLGSLWDDGAGSDG
ncbi:hypothetical protein PG984_010379 [Apiospora sp. TS-2023a]